jgi:hypothetical protein
MILLVFFIFGFPLALLLAIHSGFKKSSRAQLEAGERQREAVLYTTELGRQQLAIEQAERKRNQRNEVIGKLIATAAIVIGLFIWSTNRVTEHQSAIATPDCRLQPSPDSNSGSAANCHSDPGSDS